MPGALGQQLRRLAGWAIASSLGAAIGCSADQTMAGADGPGFAGAGAMPPAPKKLDTSGPDWQIVPCDALLLATDPIHPAQALDYFGVLGPKYLGANVLISDYGVACMGAADREQCLDRLKQLTLSTALCEPPAICKSFTVSTRGDLVERQDDLPSLRALFGEIDTPSEAAVVAMTQGLMLACGDVEAKVGTRVQTTA
jgi:hypothetical protein